jgi:hypothetical protein
MLSSLLSKYLLPIVGVVVLITSVFAGVQTMRLSLANSTINKQAEDISNLKADVRIRTTELQSYRLIAKTLESDLAVAQKAATEVRTVTKIKVRRIMETKVPEGIPEATKWATDESLTISEGWAND